MASLVKNYGSERITWRYDPLVMWKESGQAYTNYNSENFRYLCKQFSALGIQRCYFSVATLYRKFHQRFTKRYPGLTLIPEEETNYDEILLDMQDTATAYGIKLYSCCNDGLGGYNIFKGRCISGVQLNKLRTDSKVSEAKHATRNDCGCTRSIDIGDYVKQPCPYGCIYCYANPVWE